MVRHRWPSSSRFAFNCYQHAAQLLICHNGCPCSIILSQEGMTQGNPILMVIYSVVLTPLMETVRDAQPTILQPWYADSSSFGGTAPTIATAMQMILEKGPTRGYYPEPSKSILICNPAVRNTVQAELGEFHFQYEDGYHHVDGFIGTTEVKAEWLKPQIQQWVRGIKRLTQVAPHFPQTVLAGLTKSLQLEWQYLQHVVPEIGEALAPIELVITDTFLPTILDEPSDKEQSLQ